VPFLAILLLRVVGAVFVTIFAALAILTVEFSGQALAAQRPSSADILRALVVTNSVVARPGLVCAENCLAKARRWSAIS